MTDLNDKETKRGRVRRLLIDPMKEDGFRFSNRVSAEAGRNMLDRLADDLAYMTDHGLAALRVSLRTKGEGSQKRFWPVPATVLGYAEAFERRPLDELPALLRWFASAAGRAAADADRLVAEHWFWRQYKRPPTKPADYKQIADKAATWCHRAQVIRDRAARGVSVDHQDRDWLTRYERREQYVRGLINPSADPECAA